MGKVWKEGKCDICGIITNTDSHHIIPQSQGGNNKKYNKCNLCGTHHREVHAEKFQILGWRTSSVGRILLFNQII